MGLACLCWRPPPIVLHFSWFFQQSRRKTLISKPLCLLCHYWFGSQRWNARIHGRSAVICVTGLCREDVVQGHSAATFFVLLLSYKRPCVLLHFFIQRVRRQDGASAFTRAVMSEESFPFKYHTGCIPAFLLAKIDSSEIFLILYVFIFFFFQKFIITSCALFLCCLTPPYARCLILSVAKLSSQSLLQIRDILDLCRQMMLSARSAVMSFCHWVCCLTSKL